MKIAIVGNPNVGKTVVFNYLTKSYADVSNYPGTTVEVKDKIFNQYTFIDTPGIYGLSGFNHEEKLARDIILQSDIIINVVDAAHLERDLFLTQHLIDARIPVVVLLNIIDEAKSQGLFVKHDVLEGMLGVPVVPAVAVEGNGLRQLVKTIPDAKIGRTLDQLNEMIAGCLEKVNAAEALLIAEGDIDTAARNNCSPGELRDEIYHMRRRRVDELVAKTVKEIKVQETLNVKLGRMMLQPLTGIPILLFVLTMIYFLVGVFIAQIVVDFTEGQIMEELYQPVVRHAVGIITPEESAVWEVLVGRFGLLTMAVTLLFGLLLPLVIGFQLVMSSLEDSGYLPRIAVLVDRLLKGMGLNGQAVVPLILGFGCVTMATITTRMLGSDRERLIVIFLLAFAVPCSAQLAIITSMLAGLGFYYFLAYGLIVVTAMVAAGTMMARLLPGYSTPLWLDLPPLRLPNIYNVLKKTWYRSTEFIKEAAPLFAGSAVVLSILDITGGLAVIENALIPLTVTWLGLPKEAAGSFVMGLIRREFGTAGLFTFPMDDLQKFVALTTITFFVPCIPTAMIIFKERGYKQGAVIWFAIFILAFLVGGIIAKTIQLINIVQGVSVMPVLAGLTILALVSVLIVNRAKEDNLPM